MAPLHPAHPILRRPKAVLAILSAGLAACTIDLAVPAGVQIDCAEGTGCPDGWVCRPELGRCVSLAALDTEPPQVEGAPVVTPPVGGHATPFAVALQASEPLARDPEVTAFGRSLTLREREGQAYVFSYVPTGDEPEGAAPVSLELVDLAGNVSGGLSGGALVFDLTPPAVVAGSASVEPALAGAESVVFVRFATDEPLGVPAEVNVGREGSAELNEAQPADGTLLFRYRATGEEPEGDAAVTVRLRDDVGNVGPPLPVGVVRFDFTAPRLTGTPTFERCDGRVEARFAANDLWLNRPRCAEGQPALKVYFTLSELQRNGALPAVSVADRELTIDEARSVPPYFVAWYEPAGDEPEASAERPDGEPVVALARDEARNEARLELGRVRFDFTPPRSPADEQALARVVWERDPHGSAGSGYEPRMTLRVAPDAWSEAGVVHAWSVTELTAPGTDPPVDLSVRTRLGSAPFSPGEATAVDAGSTARPYASFTLEDLAGNESDADVERAGIQATPVAVVEWVGTLHGKVVGDPGSNPNALFDGLDEGTGVLLPDRYLREVGSQATYLGAARADGSGVARALSTAAPWIRRTGTFFPQTVTFHALAWHEASGGMIVFGGREQVAPYGQIDSTWEWDGTRLERRLPDPSPPAREEHALAYDSGRAKVVLFGGYSSVAGSCGPEDSDDCSDTWEWDGVAWIRREPPISPPGRHGTALAYDAARRETVLFGGRWLAANGVRHLQDTWAWDGSDWTERAAASPPSPRFGHRMVYDPLRQRVVLFGGGDADAAVGDTWEWDGGAWERRDPPTGPAARFTPAMAWDGQRGAVLLYGGIDGSPFDDTWSWDGAEWSRLSPPLAPLARGAPEAAWDGGRGVVVVVSSGDGFIWEWDGEAWSRPPVEQRAPSGPAGRTDGAMATDLARSRVVLFGGYSGGSGPCGEAEGLLCSDTWTWDGARWSLAEPEHAPPARTNLGMAYDVARSVAVLFGGCGTLGAGSSCDEVLGDTWEWDGEDWTPRALGAGPPARWGHRMAYDERTSEVVAYGGLGASAGACGHAGSTACVDTWAWDGDVWAPRASEANPGRRADFGMAYDPLALAVLAFGGVTSDAGSCGVPGGYGCSDTWTRGADGWVLREGAGGPGERWSPALGLDVARGRVVMFAGKRGVSQERADTWGWTGEGWLEHAVFAHAAGRAGHSLAYDPAGRGVLVFGGRGDGLGACSAEERSSFCTETWEYAPARWRPHLVAAFDLAAASVLAPSGGDPSTRGLLDIAVRATAGGVGHTAGTGRADGERVPGYRVSASAFGRGGWVELHRDPAAAPEAMAAWEGTFAPGWTCGEPWCEEATIDQWTAADGALRLDFAPLAEAGASPEDGEMALDYVELRVRTWRTGCEVPTLSDPAGSPDGTPCRDGDPATVGETCRGHVCRAP